MAGRRLTFDPNPKELASREAGAGTSVALCRGAVAPEAAARGRLTAPDERPQGQAALERGCGRNAV